MHPATEYWLGFFETEHLHPALVPIVEKYRALAFTVASGPENQSITEAVKLLVRSKDEACRSLVVSGAIRQWDASVEKELTLAGDGNTLLQSEEPTCPARLGVGDGVTGCIRTGPHTTHRFAAE